MQCDDTTLNGWNATRLVPEVIPTGKILPDRLLSANGKI